MRDTKKEIKHINNKLITLFKHGVDIYSINHNLAESMKIIYIEEETINNKGDYIYFVARYNFGRNPVRHCTRDFLKDGNDKVFFNKNDAWEYLKNKVATRLQTIYKFMIEDEKRENDKIKERVE